MAISADHASYPTLCTAKQAPDERSHREGIFFGALALGDQPYPLYCLAECRVPVFVTNLSICYDGFGVESVRLPRL